MITPHQDPETVTADGKRVAPRIDGLDMRHLPPLEDARGEIVELYREAWDFHPDPLVYSYLITARPSSLRGWVIHREQDDRIAMLFGTLTWAFFDNRVDSPTYKMLNVFTFSERNRQLMVIPKGVYHAVKNTGPQDAVFINFPTRAYNHADPDKYRLPIKNDLIPFDFDGIETK